MRPFLTANAVAESREGTRDNCRFHLAELDLSRSSSILISPAVGTARRTEEIGLREISRCIHTMQEAWSAIRYQLSFITFLFYFIFVFSAVNFKRGNCPGGEEPTNRVIRFLCVPCEQWTHLTLPTRF